MQQQEELIPRLLTLKDIYAITGKSRMTIYRAIKNGEFPPPVEMFSRQTDQNFIKFPRWRQSDIKDWMLNLKLADYSDGKVWKPGPGDKGYSQKKREKVNDILHRYTLDKVLPTT